MTRGEAINARATAGARMVEARAAWERFPREERRIGSKSCVDFVNAELDYAAAYGVQELSK